ncbi:MAG: hypothetical protein IKS31_03990 [Clostridia bacterium]|nr:hypothetical protein [Clostridia bacterium]
MGIRKRVNGRVRIAVFSAAGLAIVLAALLWLVPMLRGQPEGWTVMVYMVGSDLESAHGLAGRDLREMAGALNADTRLIVMTDGVSDWADSPADGTCRIWRLEGQTHTLLGTHEGAMSDPAALRALLTAALPEAKGPTALILWDHGYGPMEGFGNALRSDDRRLTLSELTAALAQSGCREQPLSLIGFDACMMAGCETALALRPYAGWLLASQETEPPEGWDYGFLRGLKPGTGPRALGESVIRAYADFYRELYRDYPDLRQPCTLSLTDLGRMDDLPEAAAGLFRALETDLLEGRYRDVGSLRLHAWGFGRSTTFTEYDLIDLRRLAESCTGHPGEASAVTAALDRCVAAVGGDVSGATGLSVWFPQHGGQRSAGWLDSLAFLPLPEDWKRFIRTYEEALKTQGPAYEHTARTVPEDGVYALELSDEEARDYVRAEYNVLEGDPETGLTLLCRSGACSLEGNLLTADFRGKILTVTAEGKTLPLISAWVQEDGGTAYCQSYALDSGNGNRAIRIRIEQNTRTGEWEALSAFPLTGEMTTGRQELRMNEIHSLWVPNYIYMPVRGADDRLLPWNQWVSMGFGGEELSLEHGFTVGETPLPPDLGPCWLQIVVWDAYDRRYASELIPIPD